MVFDLLNMNIKTLNLKSDKLNKNIKNLSQFEDFYKENECQDNFKIKKINAKEFNTLYKAKLNKILLIDVREEEEFNKFSIKGSISIPINNLEQKSHLEFIKQESLVKEIFHIVSIRKTFRKSIKNFDEI